MVCLIWGRLCNCIWTVWWIGDRELSSLFSQTEVIIHAESLVSSLNCRFFCSNSNREPLHNWLEYRLALIWRIHWQYCTKQKQSYKFSFQIKLISPLIRIVVVCHQDFCNYNWKLLSWLYRTITVHTELKKQMQFLWLHVNLCLPHPAMFSFSLMFRPHLSCPCLISCSYCVNCGLFPQPKSAGLKIYRKCALRAENVCETTLLHFAQWDCPEPSQCLFIGNVRQHLWVRECRHWVWVTDLVPICQSAMLSDCWVALNAWNYVRLLL